MTTRKDPATGSKPVPHDPPDQQAGEDSSTDRWDASVESADRAEKGAVPDTDEAGTGRRGKPRRTTSSAHPEPHEPSG